MSSSAFIRAALVSCGLAFTVLGCSTAAPVQPQSSVTPNLNSGITSSNGGGMRPSNFGTSAPIKTQ